MENDDYRGKQDQLAEHSLPGTNQAGRGPSSCEKNHEESSSGGRGSQQHDQLEEHSLPGTNQSGKGPGSDERTTEDPADLDRGQTTQQ